MFAYDLKPLDILNILIKYADDGTLLSDSEVQNIRWTSDGSHHELVK